MHSNVFGILVYFVAIWLIGSKIRVKTSSTFVKCALGGPFDWLKVRESLVKHPKHGKLVGTFALRRLF